MKMPIPLVPNCAMTPKLKQNKDNMSNLISTKKRFLCDLKVAAENISEHNKLINTMFKSWKGQVFGVLQFVLKLLKNNFYEAIN